MLMIKIVTVCPLGGTCEKVVNEEIHRCAWYLNIAGTSPVNGEPINESGCAMRFLPMLQINTIQKVTGVQAATEDMRNEVTKRQDEFTTLITGVSNQAKIEQEAKALIESDKGIINGN